MCLHHSVYTGTIQQECKNCKKLYNLCTSIHCSTFYDPPLCISPVGAVFCMPSHVQGVTQSTATGSGTLRKGWCESTACAKWG